MASAGSASPTSGTKKIPKSSDNKIEDLPTIESFEDPNKPDLFVNVEATVLYNKMKEKMQSKISAEELKLLDECHTYIITEDPLWCINDNHAQFLFKILHDTSGTFTKEDKLLVLQMLQLLVLSFDYILVVKHESTHGLMSYIQKFETLSPEEKVAILILLCNCCYTKTGFYYLTSMSEWPENHPVTYNNGTIVSKIVSDCLTNKEKNLTLYDLACNLVWHLAAHKIPEEMAMDISISLLQAVKTEKDEKILYACLVALNSFLSITPEIQTLCQVMELKMDEYKGASERVDDMIAEIKLKLDRKSPVPGTSTT